jgi:hypothetical protein
MGTPFRDSAKPVGFAALQGYKGVNVKAAVRQAKIAHHQWLLRHTNSGPLIRRDPRLLVEPSPLNMTGKQQMISWEARLRKSEL